MVLKLALETVEAARLGTIRRVDWGWGGGWGRVRGTGQEPESGARKGAGLGSRPRDRLGLGSRPRNRVGGLGCVYAAARDPHLCGSPPGAARFQPPRPRLPGTRP